MKVVHKMVTADMQNDAFPNLKRRHLPLQCIFRLPFYFNIRVGKLMTNIMLNIENFVIPVPIIIRNIWTRPCHMTNFVTFEAQHF